MTEDSLGRRINPVIACSVVIDEARTVSLLSERLQRDEAVCRRLSRGFRRDGVGHPSHGPGERILRSGEFYPNLHSQ
jgi:hypothetical protein